LKILVTGGAGFVGSYVCEEHIRRDHEVVSLDLSDGAKVEHLMNNARFRHIQGSVTEELLIDREIRSADLIYHLAAIADPRVYVEDPLRTIEMDLLAGLRVVDLASRYEKKLIFTSTSEVYGRNPDLPWTEESDRVLGSTSINRWCYATSKAAVEHYIFAQHQRNGLEFVVYRLFNIYGPRLDSLGAGRVIAVFLDRFLSGKPVQVHGDGSQTRTFCYVEDAAKGIVQGSLSPTSANTVMNIGTDIETSVLELAETMKSVGGFSSAIETIPHVEVFGDSYEDIPRRVPDVTRIRELVGWQSKTSLEDGLRETIKYFSNAPEKS